MFIMDIKEQLALYLTATGLTPSELSRRTNVPQPTIHRILNGVSKEPRGSTVAPLIRFMEMNPSGPSDLRRSVMSSAYGPGVTRIRHIDSVLDTETMDTALHGRTMVGPLHVRTPWLEVHFPDVDVTNLAWGHPGIAVTVAKAELSPDDLLLIDCGHRDPTRQSGLYAMEFPGYSNVSAARPVLSYHYYELLPTGDLVGHTSVSTFQMTKGEDLTMQCVGRVIYIWQGRPV